MMDARVSTIQVGFDEERNRRREKERRRRENLKMAFDAISEELDCLCSSPARGSARRESRYVATA